MSTRFDDACKYLASNIWTRGESPKPTCCLTPSDYSDDHSYYDKVSDIIVDTIDATHFSRQWNIRGRSVKLSFYRGDCFGACLDSDMQHVKDVIVNIEEMETK